MRRFVNADIVAGAISNAVTLNRYAYANGNPVSMIDPFGLSAEDRDGDSSLESIWDVISGLFDIAPELYNIGFIDWYDHRIAEILSQTKPKSRDAGSWILQIRKELSDLFDKFDEGVNASKRLGKVLDVVGKVGDSIVSTVSIVGNVLEDIEEGKSTGTIIGEATVDIAVDAGIDALGTLVTGVVGAVFSLAFGPVGGAAVGVVAGLVFNGIADDLVHKDLGDGESIVDKLYPGFTDAVEVIVDRPYVVIALGSAVGGGTGYGAPMGVTRVCFDSIFRKY